MALYRLVCALGQQSLVTVLTRCGLPLPVYFLADEKHSHCLTEKVYLPTIVSGRVIWHLGYTEAPVRRPLPSPIRRSNARRSSRSRLSGPGHPDRWLRQHHQESADAVSWGTPRQLSPPRAHQAPEETRGHRVSGPQGLALAVPHPVVPGATAQGLARVCAGPTVTPLCRPCHHHGWSGQRRARAALVSGQESGLVCGARRPADARDQHPAGSSP